MPGKTPKKSPFDPQNKTIFIHLHPGVNRETSKRILVGGKVEGRRTPGLGAAGSGVKNREQRFPPPSPGGRSREDQHHGTARPQLPAQKTSGEGTKPTLSRQESPLESGDEGESPRMLCSLLSCSKLSWEQQILTENHPKNQNSNPAGTRFGAAGATRSGCDVAQGWGQG